MTEFEPTRAAELVAVGSHLLVDVREDSEWEAGHAPQARHIPLGELAAVARRQTSPSSRCAAAGAGRPAQPRRWRRAASRPTPSPVGCRRGRRPASRSATAGVSPGRSCELVPRAGGTSHGHAVQVLVIAPDLANGHRHGPVAPAAVP